MYGVVPDGAVVVVVLVVEMIADVEMVDEDDSSIGTGVVVIRT